MVGQFPTGGGTDEFGLVLEKDNPLVDCVEHRAGHAEGESGELDEITDQWMSEYTEAPIITATSRTAASLDDPIS